MMKLFSKHNKNETLVTAKEAWDSTKIPQMAKVVQKINESRRSGNTSTYICDHDKPHPNIITTLQQAGYDIHISLYDKEQFRTDADWFVKVNWTDEASGKITYNNIRAKQKLNIGNMNDNTDVCEETL